MTRKHCLLLLALLTTVLPTFADPVTLDRVVAVVNKTAITEFELQQRVDVALRSLSQQKVAPPPLDVLRRQVLDAMVTEHVLFDYGQDTGLHVDDAQLDADMERIAAGNKMTLPQFKTALEKDGVTYAEFREERKNFILTHRLRERDVEGKVFVADSEIDQALANNKADGQSNHEFHLAHILIQVPEGAAPDVVAAKTKRAEAAAREIADGKPFAEVAASYSESNDALSGGDIGWRTGGRLPPIFLDEIKKLRDGQVTRVIRSPAGFHILKLLGQRDADTKQIIKQTHVEHILVRINELTSENDAKVRIGEIYDRIIGGAKFEEQAKTFSEDTSASRGGDLDWISPGDTVPEFEQAMDALKPGEMSKPVRSPYGWHLIKVLERREQDVTKDNERLRVKNELHERKADELYDEWVRQQHDRAYIELHLDDK
jgi:peptidyl-prolyl cis-trans isomerase SurA